MQDAAENNKNRSDKATKDVTEYEEKKQEEEDVVKKLTEMEEELKVRKKCITFEEFLSHFIEKHKTSLESITLYELREYHFLL